MSPKKQTKKQSGKNNSALGAGIQLYSNASDHYCHRARFALLVKNVKVAIVEVKDPSKPQQILRDLNPYFKNHPVPTLVERDLVLYHPTIVLQYINDRFPYPPLTPQVPANLAKHRMQIWRIEKDIVARCDSILTGKNRYRALKVESELLNQLVSLSYYDEERFNAPNDEDERSLDMIDCILAPVLWRLAVLGITLPGNAKRYQKLMSYMKWLFAQDAFMKSCSSEELEMLAEF